MWRSRASFMDSPNIAIENSNIRHNQKLQYQNHVKGSEGFLIPKLTLYVRGLSRPQEHFFRVNNPLANFSISKSALYSKSCAFANCFSLHEIDQNQFFYYLHTLAAIVIKALRRLIRTSIQSFFSSTSNTKKKN